MAQKLSDQGAEVTIFGEAWDDANQKALELRKLYGEDAEFIHPFDQEEVWEGNSFIIKEIKAQIEEKKLAKPDLMICVCGGGGLMNGLIQGMRSEHWDDVPLMVAETEGARSLGDSLDKGELVTLHRIASVCRTLGAKVNPFGLVAFCFAFQRFQNE